MDNYLIFNALYNNNYQDVIYILNNYVNPNCQNEYGYTPLMVACINGNIQIVPANTDVKYSVLNIW
jgi:ankyrin repeat protein